MAVGTLVLLRHGESDWNAKNLFTGWVDVDLSAKGRDEAILDIWYPGTQGGAAVASLLFGDVSPGGKLPFTWPRTVGQVPMIYSHTRSHEPENQARRYWDEESTPLFAFGHG